MSWLRRMWEFWFCYHDPMKANGVLRPWSPRQIKDTSFREDR